MVSPRLSPGGTPRQVGGRYRRHSALRLRAEVRRRDTNRAGECMRFMTIVRWVGSVLSSSSTFRRGHSTRNGEPTIQRVFIIQTRDTNKEGGVIT